jgi:hypothetical protein
MSILGVATKYFEVPKTLTTFNHHGIEELTGLEVVAKSLSSETSEDRKVLHTTKVDLSRLDPKCLWYLQEKLDSRWDVTIFFCNGSCFPFRRSREGLKGLDWRAEQSFDYSEQEWFQFAVDPNTEEGVRKLSADLGIEFGRYDFMSTADNELLFLEVNANGQWVFLDIHDKYGLLNCVTDWLREKVA